MRRRRREEEGAVCYRTRVLAGSRVRVDRGDRWRVGSPAPSRRRARDSRAGRRASRAESGPDACPRARLVPARLPSIHMDIARH